MADTYTKLFSSIVASTVWGEPHATRSVWTTMLALSDREGVVNGSVPGLARLANATLQETEAALATFMAPDTYSRTPDNEGRRIEQVPGGWRLLNHAMYREKMNADDRREYKRRWDQQKRGRNDPTESDKIRHGPTNADANPTDPTHTASDSDSDSTTARAKSKSVASPTGSRLPADWVPSDADVEFAKRERPDVDWFKEAEKFRDYWRGQAGAKGRKADWPATWRNWIRRADAPKGAARAGPQDGPQSKQGMAIQALMGMKSNANVDQRRNHGRPEQAALLGAGSDTGGGIDPWHGDGVE